MNREHPVLRMSIIGNVQQMCEVLNIPTNYDELDKYSYVELEKIRNNLIKEYNKAVKL